MSEPIGKAGTVVLAVLLVGGAAIWYGRSAPPAVETAPAVAAPVSPDTITVHVAGAVLRPGLVSLPAGARIADAVAAAGGAGSSADLASLNLAGELSDGQQVVVPAYGADAPVGAVVEDGRVRLNDADAGDIERLPGVGPVLAARIVAHRDAFGPFETVEDLLDVSGIGEAKLASIRDAVIVP